MVFRTRRARRPLLRAAAVGGGAYVAGKRVARRQAEEEQAEAEQDARISDLERQQAPPPSASPTPAAAGAGGAPASIPDQLKQMAELRDQGILTDDEFSAAKARLLGLSS